MKAELSKQLQSFIDEQKANKLEFLNKGALAIALVVTDRARQMSFPLDREDFITEGGGQVAGAGKSAVQKVLEKYKIFKTLAQEGGRTSRGSIRRMEAYVHWLNKIHGMGLLDLEAIERYWIGEVEKFFHAKPFKIRELSAHSVEAIVSDLLEEAFRRQQRSAGTMYAGTLLQHLVGAKLELKWPGRVTHHPAAEADDVSDRPGDFLVEDASIHVTTSPSDTLVEKCTANLHQGCRPVIVTVEDSVGHARTIAKRGGILSRIEIQSAQQFLSSNINEWSGFKASARTGEIKRLVAKYNELIDAFEGDPSLRIELR